MAAITIPKPPLPANARPSPLDAVLNVIRGSALGSATIAAEFVAKLALANSTFWQASQKNNEANGARLLAKSTAPQESQYHVFLPNPLDRLPLSLLTDPISERAKLRPACIFIMRLLRSSIEAMVADQAAPNQRAGEMEDPRPFRQGRASSAPSSAVLDSRSATSKGSWFATSN